MRTIYYRTSWKLPRAGKIGILRYRYLIIYAILITCIEGNTLYSKIIRLLNWKFGPFIMTQTNHKSQSTIMTTCLKQEQSAIYFNSRHKSVKLDK